MRILAVRLGRAGDMVMTTPALTALIECFPSAKITLLTTTDGRRLLSDFHPNIDDIWVLQGSGLHKLKSKNAIKKRLTESNFDSVFCFDTSTSISKLFAGMNTDLHLNNDADHTNHCAQIYLDMVEKACNRRFENLHNYLNVKPESENRVSAELESIGITANDTLVMLHPSFSGLKKFSLKKSESRIHRFWPTHNFGVLGERIANIDLHNGAQPKVIVDLIPDEAALGKTIRENSHNKVQILTGPPDFQRYKALIKRANLFVTANTGPMHIASAVNTRTIALFSKWNPEDCGPFMPADRYTILKAENTSHAELGLAAITVDTVYDACIHQLEAGKNIKE